MAALRIGCGWDSHVFTAGRPLWLGGLRLEHTHGLSGHSDGDVLLHAVCDALLGALGAGDIGTHFPSSEARWREAASRDFVQHALRLAGQGGWRVANLDSNLILAAPRLEPHRAGLRAQLAELLGVAPGQVSVKAKTPEGLGLDHVAQAQVVVLLDRAPRRAVQRRA